jgi:MFS family permease
LDIRSAARVRSGRLLFGGAAVGATGFFAGLAVAPLAAEDLTGAVTWSGLPGAMGIIGTALGATVVTAVLQRVGRRTGLTVGYLLGITGAVLAAASLRLRAPSRCCCSARACSAWGTRRTSSPATSSRSCTTRRTGAVRSAGSSGPAPSAGSSVRA